MYPTMLPDTNLCFTCHATMVAFLSPSFGNGLFDTPWWGKMARGKSYLMSNGGFLLRVCKMVCLRYIHGGITFDYNLVVPTLEWGSKGYAHANLSFRGSVAYQDPHFLSPTSGSLLVPPI